MLTMYSPIGKECKVQPEQVKDMQHVGYSFEKPAPKAEEKSIQKEIPKVIAK